MTAKQMTISDAKRQLSILRYQDKTAPPPSNKRDQTAQDKRRLRIAQLATFLEERGITA